MRTIILLLSLALIPSGVLAESAAGVQWTAPAGWATRGPAPMRAATYTIPPAPGDPAGGECGVYFFGAGQGGTAEANIERWINQVKQPDGSPSKDKAKIDTLTVNGLHVTTLDLLGNYSGGMSQDSAPHDSKAIYRLRGAIIDTPKGSYFAKLTGPEKTVAHWDQAFNDYIHSFEFK